MAEPIWRKNLQDAMLLDPLILVHGNVKDVFLVDPGNVTRLPQHLRNQPYVSFDTWLALEVERLGFQVVVVYDSADGAVVLRPEMAAKFSSMAQGKSRPAAAEAKPTPPNTQTIAANMPPLPQSGAPTPSSGNDGWMLRLDVKQKPVDFFRTLYENVLPRTEAPVAIICRFMDRYLSYTDRQQGEDKELSLLVQKAAMTIPPMLSGDCVTSRIILIFDLEGEVPQELNVQAPFARSVLIPSPTLEEREQFFRDNAAAFDRSEPGDRFDSARDNEHLRLIANLSEGLKMQDLLSLIALSNREKLGLGPRQIKVLLDRFKFGTRENAWLRIKPETLRNARDLLRQRVKGQDQVINEVLPVLIRAKLGMSDIDASRYSSKPRGAFFFVGPTGVGKTELSKAIAELIFGDEKAMIRFDMSEYSEEHQQARLIGAPPGYVGFDQGGQLTNAIIEKPFSVVLFDEIEKAHGRILDKFLQILDDGRLTDGMGRTVHFSEAILIFTSNLGAARTANTVRRATSAGAAVATPGLPGGDVEQSYANLAELPYDELCDHFRREVKGYFVNHLGRPEILNRIGEDNILVFNFLTDEGAKNQIVEQQVSNLARYLRETHQVGLFCTKGFRRLLMVHPHGFERNGARGVRNLLNRLVLNPLAEQLFLEPDRCHGKTFKADYRINIDRIKDSRFDQTAIEYDWVSE